ncbi:hypothetical protein [Spirosoma daeguense]
MKASERKGRLGALQAALQGNDKLLRRYKERHKTFILIDATICLPLSRLGTSEQHHGDLITDITVSYPQLYHPLHVVHHPAMSRNEFNTLKAELGKQYHLFCTIHQTVLPDEAA